ncbi:PfkB family carbohydrate kinase [Candidatus Omnitrophota bacterium]
MTTRRSILVIGSVALDSVETPFGKKECVLGGSATYFSISASFFNKVNIVAAVGRDFPEKYIRMFKNKGIGTDGLTVSSGKTFKWKGRYRGNLNEAETIYTHLNVFKDFKPRIPEYLRSSEYIFLANIDPELQADVLSQAGAAKFVACDTMNFWILSKKKELLKVLKKVDLLLLNDSEARMLSGDHNIIRAGKWIISKGPKMVVIKKGEHGSLFMSKTSCFMAPAFPLESLRDPTGAGDSFAGGMMGSLSRAGRINESSIRRSIIYGSVTGSFCVEDFSVNRMLRLSRKDIARRYEKFHKFTKF